jgi:hypothetical protein
MTRRRPGGHTAATFHPMGTTAASSREPLSAAAGPATKGQAGGLIRLSGRIPASRGHPINHLVAGAAPKAPRTEVRLAAPPPGPGRHGWSARTERPLA